MERGSDVVVIGGEIVGSAIAYQLARRGVGVVILRQNPVRTNSG
jgi:glycine/D-amino acid oxidase-like deaminating enzyme